MSRKILFAGSVAAAFATHLNGWPEAQLEMCLKTEFARSPLGRLMGLYDFIGEAGKAALATVLGNYEEFLSLISTKESRDAIEALDSNENPELEVRIANLTLAIQIALEALFVDELALAPLTRRYLLF